MTTGEMMFLKKQLRKVLLRLAMMVAAIGGAPMRPEEIEDLLKAGGQATTEVCDLEAGQDSHECYPRLHEANRHERDLHAESGQRQQHRLYYLRCSGISGTCCLFRNSQQLDLAKPAKYNGWLPAMTQMYH